MVTAWYMFVECKIILLCKEAVERFLVWVLVTSEIMLLSDTPSLPLNDMLSCATGISDVHFLLQTEIHSRL